jgi:hypothetical protein
MGVAHSFVSFLLVVLTLRYKRASIVTWYARGQVAVNLANRNSRNSLFALLISLLATYLSSSVDIDIDKFEAPFFAMISGVVSSIYSLPIATRSCGTEEERI